MNYVARDKQLQTSSLDTQFTKNGLISDKIVIINKLDLKMPIRQTLDIGNSEVLQCKYSNLSDIFIKICIFFFNFHKIL